MKYRSKQIVIDAWQYLGDFNNQPMWVESAFEINILKFQLVTKTIELKSRNWVDVIKKGDWIIRDIDGELHMCTDDIFQRNYEMIEE